VRKDKEMMEKKISDETATNVIEVKDLTKKFGELTAVDHISFDVKQGEIFGLLGPNGAGKSTTIRMLCTLTRPTEGTGKVCGFDITKDPSKVREHIGLVAEKIILYDRLTAKENLRLFGKLHHWSNEVIEQQSEKLLKLVKMEKWKDSQTGAFSTGMKQRVNIARALLNEPEIIFLDEPTLGLDPQTTRSIREFILELKSHGITMVLTTHIMAEAEMLCDRIGIIDRGKIVALDTTPELKKIITGRDTNILDISVSNLNEAMVKHIDQTPSVTKVSQRDAHKLRIHTIGNDAFDTVIDIIRAGKGNIQTITSVEPTLEDVFLHLTGHEMRDKASEKVPSARHRPHGPAKARVR
jgi:ABC-2 type transport system ATP-binding protein